MSGGSLTPEALDSAIALAELEGFEVVRSDERTLLLDLDTQAAVDQWNRVFPLVDEYYGIARTETWKSKSGNTHMKVTLHTTLSPEQRFLLQAALGSDGKREVLGLLQLQNGCIEPSVLFRPKEKA